MITKVPRTDSGKIVDGYYDVILTDRNGKRFLMTVGGNCDLFWIPENHRVNRHFEIDRTDTFAFDIFEQLFNAVEKVDDKYRPVLNGNEITFISEDWHESEANTLKIVKNEGLFTIDFIENENKSEWSFPHRGCNICFCNSGSRVPRVEGLFMRMFNFLAYQSKSVASEEQDTVEI